VVSLVEFSLQSQTSQIYYAYQTANGKRVYLSTYTEYTPKTVQKSKGRLMRRFSTKNTFLNTFNRVKEQNVQSYTYDKLFLQKLKTLLFKSTLNNRQENSCYCNIIELYTEQYRVIVFPVCTKS